MDQIDDPVILKILEITAAVNQGSVAIDPQTPCGEPAKDDDDLVSKAHMLNKVFLLNLSAQKYECFFQMSKDIEELEKKVDEEYQKLKGFSHEVALQKINQPEHHERQMKVMIE